MQPVHHGRLVGKELAVEVRDDGVAALEHLLGGLRKDRLVDVPQVRAAQVDEEDQRSRTAASSDLMAHRDWGIECLIYGRSP